MIKICRKWFSLIGINSATVFLIISFFNKMNPRFKQNEYSCTYQLQQPQLEQEEQLRKQMNVPLKVSIVSTCGCNMHSSVIETILASSRNITDLDAIQHYDKMLKQIITIILASSREYN